MAASFYRGVMSIGRLWGDVTACADDADGAGRRAYMRFEICTARSCRLAHAGFGRRCIAVLRPAAERLPVIGVAPFCRASLFPHEIWSA